MKKPLLERMANSAKYNDNVRDAWLPIWTRFAARSYHEIEKRFKVKNCDYNQLPHGKGPAIILGSGPSLDDTVPYLKDWKGAILCSTSQLAVCEANGIIPTYVVLIDADPTMVYLAEEYGDSDKQSYLPIHRYRGSTWNAGRAMFTFLGCLTQVTSLALKLCR